MIKNTFQSYFNNNYGFVIFSVLGILMIPITLYIFNAKEFIYDSVLILPAVLLASIILLTGLVYFVLGNYFFKNFQTSNRVVQMFFAATGIIIYLNDLMAPTQAPVLDGESTTIPEPMLFSLIELGIATVVIVYLIIQFKHCKEKKLLVSISYISLGLFISLSVGMIYINLSQDFRADKSVLKTQSQLIKNPEKSPNVYLLWLDAMQTDYFIKGMNELNLASEFAGFTLFEHNISNYHATYQSSNSFLSGTIYKGGDYKKWVKTEPMRQAFSDHGYNLTSYATALYVSDLDNYNLVSEQILEKALEIEHPHLANFITFSLVRMSPNFFANESAQLSQHVNKRLNSFFNPTQVLNINDRDAGMHPYVAPLAYDVMIEDETKRQDFGEFVLSQVILPHGPEVMDENCQYRDPTTIKKGGLAPKYYAQVKCALKIVTKFLQALKDLDRYENSIVIIMGDHGAGITKLANDAFKSIERKKGPVNADYSGMDEKRLLKRASALLMIKPPTGVVPPKLEISSKETQLIDIFPTILKILDWPLNGALDGRDVFADNHSQRNSVFTLFRPKPTPNFDDAEVFHIDFDPINGRTKLQLIDTFNGYFSSPNNHPLTDWNETATKQE